MNSIQKFNTFMNREFAFVIVPIRKTFKAGSKSIKNASFTLKNTSNGSLRVVKNRMKKITKKRTVKKTVKRIKRKVRRK